MEPGGGLRALLGRACGKGGDARAREEAFEELLRLVTIAIRAGMGRRLRDHRESGDVCQSVARSFVEDFEAGRLEFETEAQLAAYLRRVVKHKLVDLARADAAAKRGGGRPTARDDGAVSAAADVHGPSASAGLRADEALEGLLAGLSAEEQALVRLRRQGLSWEQIADALGDGRDAVALRQQFSRLRRRVGEGPEGGAGE